MLKVDEFSVEVCTRKTIYVNAVCFVIDTAKFFYRNPTFISVLGFVSLVLQSIAQSLTDKIAFKPNNRNDLSFEHQQQQLNDDLWLIFWSSLQSFHISWTFFGVITGASETENSSFEIMVVHILARSIGLFVVASVCCFAVSNGVSLFSWHPILMTTGVSMTNGKKIHKRK